MLDSDRPAIAITMGDPCGIGPEVVVKALSVGAVHSLCMPLVVGSLWALERAIELTESPLTARAIAGPEHAEDSPEVINVIDPNNLDLKDITVGRISPNCGKAAMEWVTAAAHLAMEGSVKALATAPVNKEAASLAGYKAIGHMELLQEVSGARNVATMLISGSLRVVHLTTHRSLRVACDYVTKERVQINVGANPPYFPTVGVSKSPNCRGESEPPRQRRRPPGHRRGYSHCPRGTGSARKGNGCPRACSRRHSFSPGYQGRLRRCLGHVSRPGTHPHKGARL